MASEELGVYCYVPFNAALRYKDQSSTHCVRHVNGLIGSCHGAVIDQSFQEMRRPTVQRLKLKNGRMIKPSSEVDILIFLSLSFRGFSVPASSDPYPSSLAEEILYKELSSWRCFG